VSDTRVFGQCPYGFKTDYIVVLWEHSSTSVCRTQFFLGNFKFWLENCYPASSNSEHCSSEKEFSNGRSYQLPAGRVNTIFARDILSSQLKNGILLGKVSTSGQGMKIYLTKGSNNL
jgi:hypothetical protein